MEAISWKAGQILEKSTRTLHFQVTEPFHSLSNHPFHMKCLWEKINEQILILPTLMGLYYRPCYTIGSDLNRRVEISVSLPVKIWNYPGGNGGGGGLNSPQVIFFWVNAGFCGTMAWTQDFCGIGNLK